jgi:hypothetical protein
MATHNIDNNNIVKIDDNEYIVISIKYKKLILPVVLDYHIYLRIKNIIDTNTFLSNDRGHIYTVYNRNILYLHDIVLRLHKKKINSLPIIHINKINMDCRIENLMFDNKNKEINKNLNKKTRTIDLPKESNININDVPTFVWYVKPDDTHGERFMICIDNITWKSTSQKDLSLRYKLEETKRFLRNLKLSRPDIFKRYSLNGDLHVFGQKLKDDYYKIINKANFNYVFTKSVNTDTLLKENLKNLSRNEILLLKLKCF